MVSIFYFTVCFLFSLPLFERREFIVSVKVENSKEMFVHNFFRLPNFRMQAHCTELKRYLPW